jgi:formylglycine-generating enzyme
MKRSRGKLLLISGFILGIAFYTSGKYVLKITATNTFCDACHTHPHAMESYKKSSHFKNESGVVTHCADCHLPPEGMAYLTEKTRLGLRDAYGTVFKDVKRINWEAKSRLENAVHFTFDASCSKCHTDLFSKNLTAKGVDAHVYYMKNMDKVRCINCHLYVGHYKEIAEVDSALLHKKPQKIIKIQRKRLLNEPFESFTETIPGSRVTFDMIAIPGGSFTMGSPETENGHEPDEGPQRQVTISRIWMAKTEVTWAEWEIYFAQMGRGKREYWVNNIDELDMVTGPTPPYGSPDQGWGKGSRPAMTMTHYAATKYCEWLSDVTGKLYRLPTEAEWEYACRAGSTDPYFFKGDPGKFTQQSLWNKIFGADTSVISGYAFYLANSNGKSRPAMSAKANPYGLYDMLGNVREFCLDYYEPQVLASYAKEGVADPAGPKTGTEHVIRGGSFKSDAADLRSAGRDYTQTNAWLMTDPQNPKSLWWYSDCTDVGFRVVRVYEK